jgi:hypothetical protein
VLQFHIGPTASSRIGVWTISNLIATRCKSPEPGPCRTTKENILEQLRKQEFQLEIPTYLRWTIVLDPSDSGSPGAKMWDRPSSARDSWCGFPFRPAGSLGSLKIEPDSRDSLYTQRITPRTPTRRTTEIAARAVITAEGTMASAVAVYLCPTLFGDISSCLVLDTCG